MVLGATLARAWVGSVEAATSVPGVWTDPETGVGNPTRSCFGDDKGLA